MATPVGDSYAVASGGVIAGGRYRTPTWAQSLSSRTWTPIANTAFTTHGASVIPAGAYLGSSPVGAMLDAYVDPVVSDDCAEISIFGGGHNDGSINGIVNLRTRDMTYSLAVAPTPPSKYPPSYTAPNSVITYPSGLQPQKFSSTLTDPADVAYNAPFDAPQARHTYGSGARRGNKINWFYGPYIVADLDTGQWSEIASADIGAQLYAINTNYASGPLGQGTMAVYDSVTDRFLVTLVPGDAGYNWRVGFFLWNPNTNTIVPGSVRAAAGLARSSMNLVKAGRHVYGLYCVIGSTGTSVGWRYNFDTGEFKHILCTGDTFTFTANGQAETVPTNYHSGRNSLIRWNYKDDIGALYEINLIPTGGTGNSTSDPLLLTQTRHTISGTPPASVVLNYRRIFYHPTADALLFIPRASSNVIAVRF